jgi:hypothetical protein
MTPHRHRLRRSPVFWVLAAHLLAALASGVTLVAISHDRALIPATSGLVARLNFRPGSIGIGAWGNYSLWVILIPLILPLVVSLATGLVFGKWGLPGHLQRRSLYYVPLLSAVYILAGYLAISVLFYGFADGLRFGLNSIFHDASAAIFAVFYMIASTLAVGLGWATALAITHHQQTHGRWETISYDEKRKM